MTKENKKVTKTRNKKLTLNKIKKEYKKINTMSIFEHDPINKVNIKYYEVFPEDKIEELLVHSYETLEYIEKEKLEPFKTDGDFYKYIGFLIIKFFTELNNEIPNDFPSQIAILNQMISTGVYRKLMNDMFDVNEITKVYDRIAETSEKVIQLNQMVEKEMAKLDKLQNKDIISKPFNVMSNPNGMLQ